jgi:hypothetical protein
MVGLWEKMRVEMVGEMVTSPAINGELNFTLCE